MAFGRLFLLFFVVGFLSLQAQADDCLGLSKRPGALAQTDPQQIHILRDRALSQANQNRSNAQKSQWKHMEIRNYDGNLEAKIGVDGQYFIELEALWIQVANNIEKTDYYLLAAGNDLHWDDRQSAFFAIDEKTGHRCVYFQPGYIELNGNLSDQEFMAWSVLLIHEELGSLGKDDTNYQLSAAGATEYFYVGSYQSVPFKLDLDKPLPKSLSKDILKVGGTTVVGGGGDIVELSIKLELMRSITIYLTSRIAEPEDERLMSLTMKYINNSELRVHYSQKKNNVEISEKNGQLIVHIMKKGSYERRNSWLGNKALDKDTFYTIFNAAQAMAKKEK